MVTLFLRGYPLPQIAKALLPDVRISTPGVRYWLQKMVPDEFAKVYALYDYKGAMAKMWQKIKRDKKLLEKYREKKRVWKQQGKPLLIKEQLSQVRSKAVKKRYGSASFLST